MRHAKAVDKNQAAIIAHLEAHGCQVVRIGEPLDLLVCAKYHRDWILIEVKVSDTHSLQRNQLEFLSTCQGLVGIATNAEQALDIAYFPRANTIIQSEQLLLTQWLIRNPEQGKLSVRRFRAVIAKRPTTHPLSTL